LIIAGDVSNVRVRRNDRRHQGRQSDGLRKPKANKGKKGAAAVKGLGPKG
jgi:hypothetical protein